MSSATLHKTKALQGIYPSPPPHWVGDGFPVRPIFAQHAFSPRMSPFLMLDYAGPVEIEPSEKVRGVGEHPHAGFETVTLVYQGELAHRDSTGSQGSIGPGDVQWMTAASGVVHEEKYSPAFARSGGTLEMVQLWVNLPAASKRAAPGYQNLTKESIPTVDLPEGAGSVRVIAGAYAGAAGPAHTFTPIHVWEVRLAAAREAVLTLPTGFTTAAVVLHGAVTWNGSQTAQRTDLALFEAEGEEITLRAEQEATVLILSGEPIPEPIVAHGPFVMNTPQEIQRAISDYQSGKMGHLG